MESFSNSIVIDSVTLPLEDTIIKAPVAYTGHQPSVRRVLFQLQLTLRWLVQFSLETCMASDGQKAGVFSSANHCSSVSAQDIELPDHLMTTFTNRNSFDAHSFRKVAFQL